MPCKREYILPRQVFIPASYQYRVSPEKSLPDRGGFSYENSVFNAFFHETAVGEYFWGNI